MKRSSEALVSDFEPLLSAAMSEQIEPVKVLAADRPRVLKIVAKDGSVVGTVTHATVLNSVARIAAIQTATIVENSVMITCVKCGGSRAVKNTGRKLPSKCLKCDKYAAWRSRNNDVSRERQREQYAKNAEERKAKALERARRLKEENPEEWRRKQAERTNAYKAKRKANRERAKASASTQV